LFIQILFFAAYDSFAEGKAADIFALCSINNILEK